MTTSPETPTDTDRPSHAMSKELLGLLGQRYSAAWSEHGTRITQRQNVVQIYLAIIGLNFGLYFHAKGDDRDKLALFVAVTTTVLTLFASLMTFIHNRVIQHIVDFMCRCEMAASEAISSQADSLPMHESLFYYWHSPSSSVDPFHADQRWYHRIILAVIFGGSNLAAILLVAETIGPYCVLVCTVVMVISGVFLFACRRFDRGEREHSIPVKSPMAIESVAGPQAVQPDTGNGGTSASAS